MTHFRMAALSLLIVGCDRPTSPAQQHPRASEAAASAAPSAPSTIAAASAVSSTLLSAVPAAPSGPIVVNFDTDPDGEPAPSFEATVGDWYVASEAGAHGLKVDGGRWRSGTPSASLADQAKRLYGDRYAEFLDGVKAFAFFPFTVWKGEIRSEDLRISVRFYPLAGQIDQAAGIAFGITPGGSYLGVRANALEDNMLFFRVVKGKRTIIDNVRDVPTPSRIWHTLVVELHGAKLSATLDGKPRLEKTLDARPQGRVGLWSKADSQVLFDDFRVETLSVP
jgi:hypothetical protein